MSHKVLILCGGAKLPANERAWKQAEKVALGGPRPKGSDLCLAIEDITRKMGENLPDLLTDLLEIAVYVYCADQAVRRGGKAEFDYGEKWRRHFRMEVPVRRPDFWGERACGRTWRGR